MFASHLMLCFMFCSVPLCYVCFGLSRTKQRPQRFSKLFMVTVVQQQRQNDYTGFDFHSQTLSQKSSYFTCLLRILRCLVFTAYPLVQHTSVNGTTPLHPTFTELIVQVETFQRNPWAASSRKPALARMGIYSEDLGGTSWDPVAGLGTVTRSTRTRDSYYHGFSLSLVLTSMCLLHSLPSTLPKLVSSSSWVHMVNIQLMPATR